MLSASRAWSSVQHERNVRYADKRQDKVLFANYLNHAECVDLEHENVTSFFYISHKTAIDR